MELLASTTALAVAVTKLVDFARNAFDEDDLAPKWVWNALALVLGLIIGITFDVNIFTQFAGNDVNAWLGRILTGLCIGAAGSGYHEVFDILSKGAKAAEKVK